MNKIIYTLFIILFIVLCFTGLYAQKPGIINVIKPGNEKNLSQYTPDNIPPALINAMHKAKTQGDETTLRKLVSEIEKYYPNRLTNQPILDGRAPDVLPPFSPGWMPGDVIINNDTVRGYYEIHPKAFDLKMGRDGNLYAAIGMIPPAGYMGLVNVYKSTNAGLNWTVISGVQIASYLIFEVSLLIEQNSMTNADSTRIMLYYTYNAGPYSKGAIYLACASFRRDGTGWYNNPIAASSANHVFRDISAVSDGQYYTTDSYMHLIVNEVHTTDGPVGRIWHYRTTNFGRTHIGDTINTHSSDYYPVSSMKARYGTETGDDTIYVAVERRNASSSDIRILRLPGTPSGNFTTYNLTSAPTDYYYQAPSITIVQQNIIGTMRKIFVAALRGSSYSTSNGTYFYSEGGASWTPSYSLTSSLVGYVHCSSDSNTAGGGYLMASFSNLGADSVFVRRGISGDMGIQTKANSFPSNGFNVSAIYTNSGAKYSAVMYNGVWNFKAYFNQEHLPSVGINQSNSSISGYELKQNYPNPFNPSTIIRFRIKDARFVTLKVFDMLGKEIATLVNEKLQPGEYEVPFSINQFSNNQLPSGVYFNRLTTGGFSETKKMILIK